MFLTIIMPIYNTEKYLFQCLESIVKQSFKNWELILIDDGSTDSSPTICNEFILRDKRIIYIHKNNGGVSSARNLGIQYAKGDWITFIDSDDYIGINYLNDLCKSIIDNNTIDFVQAGCSNYCEDNGITINQKYNNTLGTSPLYLLNNFRGLTFSKLFKRQIINDNMLRFNESVHYGEDMLFTMDYIIHVNKYIFLCTTDYYHRIDNYSSITHIFRQNNYKCEYYHCQLMSNSLYNYMHKYSIDPSECHERIIQRSLHLFNVIKIVFQNVSFMQRIGVLKSLYNERDLYILSMNDQFIIKFILVLIQSRQLILLNVIFPILLHCNSMFKRYIRFIK